MYHMIPDVRINVLNKGPRRRKREKVSPNQGPTLKYVLKYNCQMYTLNNVP